MIQKDKRDRFGRLLVPCKWCGMDTAMTGTKCCDRCWELDTRIRNNLRLADEIVTHYKRLEKVK